MVHLRLLGTFRAQTQEGLPLRFSRRKSEALVAFLALHPGPHSREKLAGLFGGEGTDDDTRRALRVVLTDVRKALGETSLQGDRDTLELSPELRVQLDTTALERHLRLGELEAALALCQGELLEGIYDDWVLPLREHYRRQVCEALESHVGRRRSAGDYAGAITSAQRLLALDPAHEPAHQHLMVCYAASGDRQSALAQYEACRAALEKRLGTAPSKETQALWQEVQRHAEGTTAAALTNLPRPLTSFIGREEALEEIETLLTQARLVTLTGMGGHGKTRLAIQAAEEGSHAFPDGVWWVELASLTEEGQLEQAIAHVLGVKERGGKPLRLQVAQALSEKRLLLLLDNAEHLLAACADTVEYLLAHCQGLTVLTTSRVRLGVPGETAWAVPPLTVPIRTELKYLKKNESVQFFIERGRIGGLQLSDENAATIATLCQRLEGIPLALELAAAQLRTQSLEQLASRIQTTLEALVSDDPTQTPRQRTLHALVAWSYALLNPVEQALFRRLAVFAGSGGLEAVAVIASGYDTPHETLLPQTTASVWALPVTGLLVTQQLLESLSEKSLLRRFRSEQGVRYGMLETLREFALGVLQDENECVPLRKRHAQYFSEQLAHASVDLYTAQESGLFALLEQELPNVREALAHQLETPDWLCSAPMLSTLRRFWQVRGYFTEARSWLTRLLEHPAALSLSEERGELLHGLGVLLALSGELETAREWLEQAQAVYEACSVPEKRAIVLNNLGNIAMDQHDLATARPLFEQARLLAEESGSVRVQSMTLNNLGTFLKSSGNWAEARVVLGESLRLYESQGNRRGMGIVLSNLGAIALDLQDNVEAQQNFTSALLIHCEVQDRRGAMISVINLATLTRRQQDWEVTALLLGTIQTTLEQLAIQLGPEAQAAYQGLLNDTRQALGESRLDVILAQGRALSMEAAMEQIPSALQSQTAL
ncbi:ATP-binding protein [Armatimonas rosea]|uniref:Non-specific serine/threonine protein kinase n=1 Tax=Armatimonas rosea TaxID=685828 RepID=A0A7W9SY38_ARMRO|nr:BTAD domain-containing putative transcriptional regulator [Armatimonas rosea]MBB6054043.1 non-specific serine/threonine protein kinase [Armatimonas rosea]